MQKYPSPAGVKLLIDIFFIVCGIIAACIGLRGFLLPNGFFDGGAMGIALLLHYFIKVDLSVFIILVNLPFVLLGFRQISKEFAVKSALAIFALAAAIQFIHIPALTEDKLLVAIFGGVFLGTGIGLSIRGGAVIDGTEVLAVQVSRRSSLTVGDFIALFNGALFLYVAVLVNLESAMYSMLTYAAASRTVDFILNGIEEYIGITIVSRYSEQIRSVLINELHRGVTVYKIEGGYGKKGNTEERRALFCVVTRLEVTALLDEIEMIDPEAFVIQQAIRDTRGGMIKRRPLH